MDDITPLRIFLEVARRQSFTAAAEYFGLSPSAVSKQVATLERLFQARLLNRTTKKMHLTRAGAFVVQKAPEILQGLEDLQETVLGLTGDVTGLVRVGAAPHFGAQRLTAMIAAFSRQYPNIQVSLTLLSKHRIEDFVEVGLDVGVLNSSSLPDMTHSAYTITDMPQVAVASPAFLAGRPPLRSPADLADCDCLVNTYKSPTGSWRFTGPDGPQSVRVRGRMVASYGEALKMAAVHDMGVSVHPRYMIANELANGSLVQVLPDYEPEMLKVYALYASRGRIPRRVRVFIDFMRQWEWRL